MPPIIGLLAGCALTGLPPAAVDAVPVTRAEVDIDITQDSAHRLVVRYRAPAAVTHLDFLLHDDRVDTAFRTPFMKAGNDCGDLVAGGVTLRHGAGCEQGAVFIVQPQAMQLDAMYEPAQPSSDGGVLFYTGFYAAAAPGFGLRWHFAAAPGDYGIDEGRRHDAAWEVRGGLAYEGEKARGDQRDDEAWLAGQHALHYVFLGHSPIATSAGLLWVRDPALPQSIVDTVGRAGPIAWKAYADAAGRQPAGQAAVVMLAMPAGQFGYHGDRSEGYMLRLAFAQTELHTLESASTFVAHEVAHLWNHGVFGSDMARPWLHEGDADWASLNAMHGAGLLPDREFVDQLQSHIDGCMMVRGDRPASTLKPGWSDEDNPYDCGFALLLLGHARRHAADPAASPLGTWGTLHQAHPQLDVTGFAQFFDPGGTPMLAPLLLDDRTPFAATYKADLAAYLALRESAAEPAAGPARRQTAANLMSAISRADCDGRLGYTLKTDANTGEFLLDDHLACHALPAGARVTHLAGVPLVARPRAAWRAVQQACAVAGRVEVGFIGHAGVQASCPQSLPDLPPLVVLPEDVLAKLGLS